jgi:flagellar motor switch protein FliN/FliY
MNSTTTEQSTGADPSWDEALAEQQQGSGQAGAVEPSWADAMHEQTKSERPDFLSSATAGAREPVAAAPATSAFPALGPAVRANGASIDMDRVLNIPVALTVELGHANISIGHLLQLSHGSIVELTEVAGQPLDILVNGCLIAHGEVVVVGENQQYGIRLTDIVAPSERIQKLGR